MDSGLAASGRPGMTSGRRADVSRETIPMRITIAVRITRTAALRDLHAVHGTAEFARGACAARVKGAILGLIGPPSMRATPILGDATRNCRRHARDAC